MTFLAIALVIALIAVNALFEAIEFALLASRESRLQLALVDGRLGAERSLSARGDLRRQLSGAQLGITASSVALGIVAQPAIGDLIKPILGALGIPAGVAVSISLFMALGLASVLQMLMGELVPKNIAISDPEGTLRRLVIPHSIFVVTVRPAIWLLDRAVVLMIQTVGRKPVDRIEHETSEAELAVMFDASWQAGMLEPFEHDLLAKALDLGTRSAEAVMIPRSDVVTVDRRMSLAEVEHVIVDSGHSRLPVSTPGADDLLGVLLAKDLLRLPVEAQVEPVPLEVIRQMLVVPPELPLEEVLLRMRSSRNHLAVVRNVAGRTLGVLTMEDVLEEIVGEIEDESDIPRG